MIKLDIKFGRRMSREVRDGSTVDVASHTCQLEAVRVGTSLIADVSR
jgi:hypothetical protein